jgi:hypothetical protein
VISSFFESSSIPPSDRSADGELKFASFFSSWLICSALGCVRFSHLHALTACFGLAGDFSRD